MKNYFEPQDRPGVFQLSEDYFLQSTEAVNMEIVFPMQEMHGEQQPHESQEMVTVQVADENVIDFKCTQLKALELLLTAFSAIDEEVMILNDQVLR